MFAPLDTSCFFEFFRIPKKKIRREETEIRMMEASKDALMSLPLPMPYKGLQQHVTHLTRRVHFPSFSVGERKTLLLRECAKTRLF